MTLSITNREFRQLADYIKAHCGIHLKDEKKILLASRLETVLLQHRLDSFTDYFYYLKADRTGEALSMLVERITTNHTYFMREPEHFHYLEQHVLPQLCGSIPDRDLRIWSAGCSSGEEPYTLAMILDRYFKSMPMMQKWDRKVLATDLSPAVLAKAAKGVYSPQAVQALPQTWQSAYFSRTTDGKCQVVDSLKREVIFRKFNLMEESFPFRKKFHVVFCRNVMIYFDADTKLRLLRRFLDITEPGGYLFMSHTESLDSRLTGYRYVRPAVYQKE